MLPRLAAWCYRRRRVVVLGWVAALVVVSVLGQTVGGDLLKTFNLPGSESQRAFDVLKKDFDRKGDIGYLVFRAKGDADAQSPDTRAVVEKIVADLKEKAGSDIVSVTTPWDTGGERFISQQDPKIGYAEILFNEQSNDVSVALSKAMRGIVKDANSSQLQVELGGFMFADQTQPASELIGVLAAVLILLIAFGSLLAMGLPIITALFGIGVGLAVVNLLARVLDVP